MTKRITDYKPLTRNPNKGTQKGTGILDQSVRELGAGRSLLVDKNGVILAGNHAQEAFVNAGIENVIEVETDGNQVVVVKRTDMDANSTAGKKMAIMDNRTSEQGLAWDAVVLEEMLDEIKQDEGELDRALAALQDDLNPPEIDYEEMWQGMPEFEQEDQTGILLKVHFINEDDRKEFFNLIKQPFTDKTISIWYPERKRGDMDQLGTKEGLVYSNNES